jgi:hypothetical protein
VLTGGSIAKLREARGYCSVIVTERYAHLRGDVTKGEAAKKPSGIGLVAQDGRAGLLGLSASLLQEPIVQLIPMIDGRAYVVT